MADKTVASLTSSTPTIDDLTISYDNADTSELKKTTWQLVRDLFKTYFDTIYQAVLVSWTNIKTVNGNSLLGSGDITISGGGSVATDAIWDAKWDLAGGTGANTASRLAVGTNWQVLTADSAEVTGLKWSNPAGGWDALTSWTLAQFAATTSLQLKGVISDETGSGSLVFANSPTLVTPALGTPASGTLTNCIDLPLAGLVDINTNRILGRSTAGTGAVEELNVTAIPALIGLWTSDSPQFTGVNVGHATDTTITRVSAGKIAVEWVNVVTTSSTDTLTNKRVTKRVETVASSATPASNTDSYDITKITSLATAITSLTSGLTGTPADGDMHLWSITDNGTARALTLGASFEASTVAIPTTTVISTRLDMLCIWNSSTSKWRVVAVA